MEHYKSSYFVNLAYKQKTILSFSIKAYSYEEFKDRLLEKLSDIQISDSVKIIVTKEINSPEHIVADYSF